MKLVDNDALKHFHKVVILIHIAAPRAIERRTTKGRLKDRALLKPISLLLLYRNFLDREPKLKTSFIFCVQSNCHKGKKTLKASFFKENLLIKS